MIIRIFNRDLPVRNLFFVFGEGVLIYVVVMMWTFISQGRAAVPLLSSQVLVKALLIMVVCLISFYLNDLYNLKITDSYVELGRRLTRAMGIACILLALIYYGVPSLLTGRGIFVVSILFILQGISWRYAYSYLLKKRMFTEKVLVLGSGEFCRKILEEIGKSWESGYQVTGLISTNSLSKSTIPPGIKVFKASSDICELAESLMCNKIIVAMDQRRGSFPTQDLLRCRVRGIKILEGESFYEKLTGKILVEQTHPSWLIFSEGFRKSRFTRIMKRASDLIFASLGLLVILPLIGIIGVAIKLDSKGPIIFKQERCGEGERPFRLYKFRSMVDNAEEGCGPTWAQGDDHRVTRAGRILRKFRLDEIPQMWNVLKGDMSFVGPRPERPEFVEQLKRIIPYYSERHSVKPGITGWAQISYGYAGSVEDALEKLKYDLFYVKNMNILTDIVIVLRTIKAVLKIDGVGRTHQNEELTRIKDTVEASSPGSPYISPQHNESVGHIDRKDPSEHGSRTSSAIQKVM